MLDSTPRYDTVDAPTQAVPDEFDSLIGITLADAIREGSKETAQAYGWGDGVENACALTAAGIVVRNKGYRANGAK
jgi:hypothetical protein